MSAAIAAVDPSLLVRRALGAPDLIPAGPPIAVIAVGKGSAAMAHAALGSLGDRVRTGVAIGPGDEDGARLAPLRWVHSSHPVPDASSVGAARAALAVTEGSAPGDVLLVLVSGGASALMALPVQGLSLGAKQVVTRRLLAAGASIREINCVRKHLSGIKGGHLAVRARGPLVTLALSDVVGDDPSVIGSGPTVPDPSTYADALDVVARHGGSAAFPREAMAHLEAGAHGDRPETPKPGDAAFARARYVVIGSGAEAVNGAAAEARARGYVTHVLPEPVTGEARAAAGRWVADVARTAATGRRVCVLSSGETTVEVRGPGRGGRNQEFALALAPALAALDRPAVAASVGTDGVDGPTDAAGALVDSTTTSRAATRGLALMGYLEANDSWSFFDMLGDLVRTGPTGTNVGDLQVALFGD